MFCRRIWTWRWPPRWTCRWTRWAGSSSTSRTQCRSGTRRRVVRGWANCSCWWTAPAAVSWCSRRWSWRARGTTSTGRSWWCTRTLARPSASSDTRSSAVARWSSAASSASLWTLPKSAGATGSSSRAATTPTTAAAHAGCTGPRTLFSITTRTWWSNTGCGTGWPVCSRVAPRSGSRPFRWFTSTGTVTLWSRTCRKCRWRSAGAPRKRVMCVRPVGPIRFKAFGDTRCARRAPRTWDCADAAACERRAQAHPDSRRLSFNF